MDDVRFRVGCAGPVAPVVCAAWNTGMLDTGATHTSRCDFPEAARAVAALVKGTITALRSHGRRKGPGPHLALTNLQLPSERRPATRSRPRMHPSAAPRPYAVECTAPAPPCPHRFVVSTPFGWSQHLRSGSQHLNFLDGVETHFGCVETHLGGVEIQFGSATAILWVLYHR